MCNSGQDLKRQGPSLRRFLLHAAGGAGIAALVTVAGIMAGAPVPWYAAALPGSVVAAREFRDWRNQTKGKTAADVASWPTGAVPAALLLSWLL